MADSKPHDFSIDGFLSPQVVISAASTQCAETQRVAALCVELNQVSLRRLLEIPFNAENPASLVSVLLAAQATTSFESAVLLASMGMEGEARTLIRRCVEASISCYALLKRPDLDILSRFVEDRRKHYRRLANELPRSLDLAEEHPLRKYMGLIADGMGDVSDGKKLDLNQLAEAAGIKDVYDTIFRYLSADASHPTLDSLQKVAAHNAENGNMTGMLIQPRFGELGITLLIAAFSQLLAMEALQILYPDVAIEKTIPAYKDTMRGIFSAMYPEWVKAFVPN